MAPEPDYRTPVVWQGSPGQILFQMITGYRISQMVCVAARLGIADLIKDDPRTAEELAEATGTHAPSLYRVLRTLASLGVFAEDEQKQFEQTPLSNLLRPGVPGSLYPVAAFYGEEAHWRSWGDLMYSVTSGENAFRHIHGMQAWEYRARHPELGAVFDSFMTSVTASLTAALVAAYDFSWARTVVDVGGGRGALLAAILEANPHLRGILCDAPHVVENARPIMKAAGVLDRCDIQACDFFESVPAGGDLYLLKSIIHDWDDEHALAILQTCRSVVPDGGRLLLVENVIPPGNDPHPGKVLDIEMLVDLGGRERVETEFRALLSRAGFRLTRILPTKAFPRLIEAVPD